LPILGNKSTPNEKCVKHQPNKKRKRNQQNASDSDYGTDDKSLKKAKPESSVKQNGSKKNQTDVPSSSDSSSETDDAPEPNPQAKGNCFH